MMSRAVYRLAVIIMLFFQAFSALCFSQESLFYRVSSTNQTRITFYDGSSLTWTSSVPGSAYVVEATFKLDGNWSTNLPVSEVSVSNEYTTVSLISTNWVPGQLLVGIVDNSTPEDVTQLFESYDLQSYRVSKLIILYKAYVQPGTELMWIDILTTNAIVEYAEPNLIFHAD